jgi:hypothetical protein
LLSFMVLQVGITWGAPVEVLAGPRGFDLPGPVREFLALCCPANPADRGTMEQVAELSFSQPRFRDVHTWPPVRRTVREQGLVVELCTPPKVTVEGMWEHPARRDVVP